MMLKHHFFAIYLVVASLLSTLSHAESTPTHYPAHPRLIATKADWQRLAIQRQSDPVLDRYGELLLKKARSYLDTPLIERTLAD